MQMDDTAEKSLQFWNTVPSIHWHFPVKRLKPGAITLLAHPTVRLEQGEPMPLIAAHYYGKGYVLFVGFDETWRWRRNEADKFFYRFWSQAVYTAGLQRTAGTGMTQLSLNTPDPTVGRIGQLYAQLLDENLQPITADKIAATIERTDTNIADAERVTKVLLNRLPNDSGEFVATLPFNKEGNYTLRVENGKDTGVLQYRVSLPPENEQSAGPFAEDLLRELAESTGGHFYREEDLNSLPDRVTVQTHPYTQREEFVLWNRWVMLFIILLFGLEWTIRKLQSLS
jgi:hypothetical protein